MSTVPGQPADASPPALSVRNLRMSYGAITALEDVSLDIADGEFVTLLGPSGCGKTTLLRSIAGFLRPDAGAIDIAGQPVIDTPPERRHVNLVFQRYALFPHLDVAGNVAFGPRVAGTGHREVERLMAEVLVQVRLEGFENRRISTLSGGQQQRVALARAIINKPKILLLDEPLGALDLQLRREMQLELRALHQRLGTTFVYVTHDQEEALVMSDRIVVMQAGGIEQKGSPQEVYRKPKTPFVAGFIGESNFLEGTVSYGSLTVSGVSGFAMSILEDVPNGPVLVSVRPEHLALGEVGSGGVSVEVQDAIFMGSAIRYSVVLSNGQTLVVIDNAPNAPMQARGARASVTIDSQNVRVFSS